MPRLEPSRDGQLAWSENAMIDFSRARPTPSTTSTAASRVSAFGISVAVLHLRVLCSRPSALSGGPA
eukprot:5340990-Prymnesium_polylepis.1